MLLESRPATIQNSASPSLSADRTALRGKLSKTPWLLLKRPARVVFCTQNTSFIISRSSRSSTLLQLFFPKMRSLCDRPYDGAAKYKGLLGLVLPAALTHSQGTSISFSELPEPRTSPCGRCLALAGLKAELLGVSPQEIGHPQDEETPADSTSLEAEFAGACDSAHLGAAEPDGEDRIRTCGRLAPTPI